ncbi:sperm-associated antigen 7 homolog [Anastrepha ludens]|uniref:sperm-associated antigen 7 homolog n=1 Tax=Anastrepha ludens TaxID=28586 RepID=UPI0023B10DD1|nr:sperm-associated antigen 7 homolog [Anastrepha ludens]
MDLLNSILNSMDKPPAATEQQKKLIKKQKELAERIKNKHKEELNRFRKYVEDRIERFAKDDRPHIEFQPLDKVHRAIIHEVAEFGGFIAMSFGREDIDRHSVVYKKENAPSEDEIAARRNGDGWNEEVAKEYAEKRKQQRELESEQKRLARASTQPTPTTESDIKPTSNYKDKYAHLIGQEAALEAARKTETNLSYGFVPSKNKKDMRSIEQTLADIQAKKKRKLEQQQQIDKPDLQHHPQDVVNQEQNSSSTYQRPEEPKIAGSSVNFEVQ